MSVNAVDKPSHTAPKHGLDFAWTRKDRQGLIGGSSAVDSRLARFSPCSGKTRRAPLLLLARGLTGGRLSFSKRRRAAALWYSSLSTPARADWSPTPVIRLRVTTRSFVQELLQSRCPPERFCPARPCTQVKQTQCPSRWSRHGQAGKCGSRRSGTAGQERKRAPAIHHREKQQTRSLKGIQRQSLRTEEQEVLRPPDSWRIVSCDRTYMCQVLAGTKCHNRWVTHLRE